MYLFSLGTGKRYLEFGLVTSKDQFFIYLIRQNYYKLIEISLNIFFSLIGVNIIHSPYYCYRMMCKLQSVLRNCNDELKTAHISIITINTHTHTHTNSNQINY